MGRHKIIRDEEVPEVKVDKIETKSEGCGCEVKYEEIIKAKDARIAELEAKLAGNVEEEKTWAYHKDCPNGKIVTMKEYEKMKGDGWSDRHIKNDS